MIENYAISFSAIFVILTILYGYMFDRMKKIAEEQKAGTYYPNMSRSLIELITFLLVYLGCTLLALLPEYNLTTSLTGALIAFFISMFTFNKLIFEKLKFYIIPFSTIIMFGFYVLLAYVNTNI